MGCDMIRLLDTREQKSPRFLMDAFPDLQITVMESGDYFSGKMEVPFNSPEPFNQLLTGNLVEIKIGSDFGIHTEPLERFQDELYRMSCYRQKNPHVQLHAVWMPSNISNNSEDRSNGAIFVSNIMSGVIYFSTGNS